MAMGLCALGRSRPSVRSLQKFQGCLWSSSSLYSTGNSAIWSNRPNRACAPRHRGTPFGFPPALCVSAAFSTGIQRETGFRLEEYWTPVSAAVNMALDSAVPVSYPEKIHEAMRYSIFSAAGKMPCPVMCIAACELVGGSRDRVLPVACALEMIRSALLIHDDLPCMDNVSFHGGQAASHAVFGEDVAVLAGDALLTLAFQHVAEASEGVPPERVLKVICELSKAAGSKGMAGGELMDLMSGGGPNVDPALLEYIHMHKSALMAECSLVGGAIVGGASGDEAGKLRRCGRAVGLMYQVVEDMRRVEVQQAEGKGKATYPEVYGMDRCRQIVQELQNNAKQCLSQFEQDRAQPLLGLVDHAAARHF